MIELDKTDFKKLKADISSLKYFQVDTTDQKLGVTESYRDLTKGNTLAVI